MPLPDRSLAFAARVPKRNVIAVQDAALDVQHEAFPAYIRRLSQLDGCRPALGTSDNDDAELNSRVSAPNPLPGHEFHLPSPEHELLDEAHSRSSIVGFRPSMETNGSSTDTSTSYAGSHGHPDTIRSVTNGPLVSSETLDFSGLELFCPINADDISNRWLNSYVPVPGQRIKEYPASITAFIYRILKSYAAATVRGRGVPPFVHASQLTAKTIGSPLATCLSLARVCDTPLPGSQSAAMGVLQREMDSLYERHQTYDDITLFAAFQAYLIYSMVLFFRLSQGSDPFLRQAMMTLQALACSSSRGGLMCTAEQQQTRPRWEAWIVAEAKRRTLFTMYLFDSLLSSHDGLPTFLGTELEGLPASSSQSLWRAQTRRDWEIAYNIHMTDWADGCLKIDELWPIPANLDEAGRFDRRNRVDQWLEDVDEFGTMTYAVTSCTHGG